ncbi:hypothetical protein V2K79_18155 [Pseudomonas alliivorans]|uniref:Myosin heavy chain B n=1 Tax=Pseudomonas alliivorans TaxID=2810613 RepID=A0ABS4C2Z3_9PSED|nr:hypothetical protein [Pseudomonas alliivorans]MBP0944730.1 hypothetical protein [Pseudomonas alliivorans]MEE4324826.1 hypothetical protein [Pseudomonas alliivorans]MEE4333137.1 hypothetical protein [Pseudomonas alliivorans]MEE4366356.1 hypothetical protein [Pseudomonas alliivorans]MEE4573570.1 hypothetical protein [Pseudomonas alliivorans]
MKMADLHNLQALRLLREQRASAHLATQRERCRETRHHLDQARETLRLHREMRAQEAEQAYGLFSEGVSVSAWHAAQVHLKQLDEEREALQADVNAAALNVETEEQARERLRVEHRQRQQQSRAWQSLLEQRLSLETRQGEQRDEAEQLASTSDNALSVDAGSATGAGDER